MFYESLVHELVCHLLHDLIRHLLLLLCETLSIALIGEALGDPLVIACEFRFQSLTIKSHHKFYLRWHNYRDFKCRAIAFSFCKYFNVGASVMNLRSVEKLVAMTTCIPITRKMLLKLSLLLWNKKTQIF